jgi:excisionase family DNA binding protein
MSDEVAGLDELIGDLKKFSAKRSKRGPLKAVVPTSEDLALMANQAVPAVMEASRILRLSRMATYEAVWNGDIPSVKVGRRILVPVAGLKAFLESGATKSREARMARRIINRSARLEGRAHMSTQSQEEQAERREVMLQDADLRRQQQQKEPLNTMHQHAQAAANDISGGRFGALGAPHVVGSAPIPKYPAASAPFQRDPVPAEPPTGYCIDEMPVDPSTPPSVEDSGDPTNARPASAPLSGELHGVGSPLSQSDIDDQTNDRS